jgi:hypothetical protein
MSSSIQIYADIGLVIRDGLCGVQQHSVSRPSGISSKDKSYVENTFCVSWNIMMHGFANNFDITTLRGSHRFIYRNLPVRPSPFGTLDLLRGNCFCQIRTGKSQFWRIYGDQVLINFNANYEFRAAKLCKNLEPFLISHREQNQHGGRFWWEYHYSHSIYGEGFWNCV